MHANFGTSKKYPYRFSHPPPPNPPRASANFAIRAKFVNRPSAVGYTTGYERETLFGRTKPHSAGGRRGDRGARHDYRGGGLGQDAGPDLSLGAFAGVGQRPVSRDVADVHQQSRGGDALAG